MFYHPTGNCHHCDALVGAPSFLLDMFPSGMNVVSLFFGIGAEIALHRPGIRLEAMISLEQSELNNAVLKSWCLGGTMGANPSKHFELGLPTTECNS
ncbi:hypothetical protein ACP70R_001978 [Stipagrostis hirtigluma subsp. patula]